MSAKSKFSLKSSINGKASKTQIFGKEQNTIIADEIPCDRNNPCQNGGICSGTVLSYQCSCAEGYTGTNCESKYILVTEMKNNILTWKK